MVDRDDINNVLRLDPAEQAVFDKQMNLYSVIKTLELLEFAYCNG